MNAVFRNGVAKPMGYPPIVAHGIPNLEQLIRRVVPHSAAVGKRHIRLAACLPGLIRLQHRVDRMVLGGVKCAIERGLLNQKIVDEKLPADVNRNHRRRIGQVRRRHRFSRRPTPRRRPLVRQFDTVVQSFTTTRRPCQAQQDREHDGQRFPVVHATVPLPVRVRFLLDASVQEYFDYIEQQTQSSTYHLGDILLWNDNDVLATALRCHV